MYNFGEYSNRVFTTKIVCANHQTSANPTENKILRLYLYTLWTKMATHKNYASPIEAAVLLASHYYLSLSFIVVHGELLVILK